MDPNASDVIRKHFKVENVPSMYKIKHNSRIFSNYYIEGADGYGLAVISSLTSFDREKQKEYLIPIVIRDDGYPPMSATSTISVVIGDVNDNKMSPGQKSIMVYKYKVIRFLECNIFLHCL